MCGEMFVYEFEKSFSYVGLYFFVVGRVELNNVSFSFIFVCTFFFSVRRFLILLKLLCCMSC